MILRQWSAVVAVVVPGAVACASGPGRGARLTGRPPVACGQLRAWDASSAFEEQPQGARAPWVTRSGLTLVAAAAERFCLAKSRYPESLSELVAFSDSLGPREVLCRLYRDQLTDEWGTPIRYTVQTAAPVILSAGPDRTFGTADDVGLPSATDSLGFRIEAQKYCFPPYKGP